MLRITPSVSASRAKSYYSTADYYTEGQELIGHWRGKGAERLGLAGTVKQSDWDRLCDNRRPDDGKPLTVRRRSERRVGYDFNFHVPKSLSLLYGLTRDERLLAAFRESVGETMREMEAEAKHMCKVGAVSAEVFAGHNVYSAGNSIRSVEVLREQGFIVVELTDADVSGLALAQDRSQPAPSDDHASQAVLVVINRLRPDRPA